MSNTNHSGKQLFFFLLTLSWTGSFGVMTVYEIAIPITILNTEVIKLSANNC